MKAVAFANNDMAIMAWTFGGRIDGCLGFAIYRIDVNAGTETCLPALAAFPTQDASKERTTADDPVQKFFWKDVEAKRGGSYRYRIEPRTGAPGDLHPMPIPSLTTNTVALTPHLGVLSAYFNRGILATQATVHALHDDANLGAMKTELLQRIADPTDPLRADLAGQMIDALTALPRDAAATDHAELFCALYEFGDPQLTQTLDALGRKVKLILSNMPGPGTKDTYADERKTAKEAGVAVIDRMLPSGHIGHNKFVILETDGVPQAVEFGSTNWTDTALCAQSNNTIVARSPLVAAAYKTYWDDLKADTVGQVGKQGRPLRRADAAGPIATALEDGSGDVHLWFSPNTDHLHRANDPNEATPPDMAEISQLIAGAKQAVLFVAFEPGKPSIIEYVAAAQKANPALFVRGTVTVASAAEQFAVAIKGDAPGTGHKMTSTGGTTVPGDYRVIAAQGVRDPIGVWETELNNVGHAVTHSKYVVIDPFSDGCAVITGSHNLGFRASCNNDENLAIIKGHRALAEAYAANALDIYDHYAWRWWLTTSPKTAWTSLRTDDTWQNTYFDGDSRPVSPELTFWLAATPAAEALPTPSNVPSDRPNVELRKIASRGKRLGRL